MALSFLGFAPKNLTRPQITEDGAWNFFGGDFKTYFISGDKDHYTSRQIFKAGSPHTGAGRGSTATPPYGYLSSVTMAKQQPNPAQMLLFMDSADVILVDIPLGLGGWANLIIGRWIGGYLLGMKASYKEFTEE
ncbi:hypothetical protein RQP46_007629 [Phenoliferia psychrophenolica]